MMVIPQPLRAHKFRYMYLGLKIVKPVFGTKKKWPLTLIKYKTGDLLKEVQFI